MASFGSAAVAAEGALAKAFQAVAAVVFGSYAEGQESTETAVSGPFAMAATSTSVAEIAQEGSDRTTLAVGLGRRTGASNTACANGLFRTLLVRKLDTAAGAEVPGLGDFPDTSARARSGSRDRLGCHIDRAGYTRWGLDTALCLIVTACL